MFKNPGYIFGNYIFLFGSRETLHDNVVKLSPVFEVSIALGWGN